MDYLETTILRAQDIMELLGCAERTATAMLRDIKQAYGLTLVLACHYRQYLKIPDTVKLTTKRK